jgi:chromate transport protein ChrA
MMEKVEKWSESILWRIIGTIVAFAAFLVGSLIYVGFYAKGYNAFQDFVVVAVALIIALAAIAIMWVTFAGRRGWMRDKWGS